jgi:hypothetical protein
MADPERDARVSEHYRALGREEPAPEIDAAILAASRRRRSRWAVPVSIAAVVVLAVGVTLRVQLEKPEVAEPLVLQPKVMRAPAAAKPAMKSMRETAPLAAREEPARDEARARPAPASPASPPAGAAASAPADIALGKISRAPETPEQWLERIAKLRAAGRDREADESLVEFKRRFPDYRIPDKMRARIAPR